MNNLHPGVRWYFRFGMYALTFIVLLVIFIAIGVAISSFLTGSNANLLIYILIFVVLVVLIGETFTRMAYNRWLYDFDETGLRIERGIIWKKYSTVPYERIQNVDIRRGILARIFGFSSLHIHTAGYAMGIQSEGYIPGVSIEEAENIRNRLMSRITRRKGR